MSEIPELKMNISNDDALQMASMMNAIAFETDGKVKFPSKDADASELMIWAMMQGVVNATKALESALIQASQTETVDSGEFFGHYCKSLVDSMEVTSIRAAELAKS